jgi:hypothetical protein
MALRSSKASFNKPTETGRNAVTKHDDNKTPVKAKEAEILTPIRRSTRGLTQLIFDEIELIRQGNSTPTRANAVAKMGNVIVETIRLEMEMERHAEKHRNPMNPDNNGPTDKELD